MLTTNYIPGSPCWLDLGSPDVSGTVDFHRAVFGWDYQPVDSEATGDGGTEYGFFKLHGRTVAAVGTLTEPDARPAWMIYYAVPDADATEQAVRQAGGTVRVAPTDVDGEARIAQFSDPQGGQFAVMQPGKTAGLEAVNEAGALVWTELYTTDVPGARAFYGSVFGWQTDPMTMPGGDGAYTLVRPDGADEELTQGGMMQLAPSDLSLTYGRPYWHPVFAVADCDATVTRFRENGGQVLMGPMDAEGVGRLAVCLDPSGADCVVLTPSP